MKIDILKKRIEALREVYNFNDEETDIRINNYSFDGVYCENSETVEIKTRYNNVLINLIYEDREKEC